MDMRASGPSELRKVSHFHILKLLSHLRFCWYFCYFVLETCIGLGYQFTSASVCTINAVSFYYIV